VITAGGKQIELKPRNFWNSIKLESENPPIEVDPDFYVAKFNIMGPPSR
jgi:hypothetical protein